MKKNIRESYNRLMAIAKSRGHYDGVKQSVVKHRVKITPPTDLKHYLHRLHIVQTRLVYYRPMKLNYKQVQLVSELRFFEDELKRRIAICRT